MASNAATATLTILLRIHRPLALLSLSDFPTPLHKELHLTKKCGKD